MSACRADRKGFCSFAAKVRRIVGAAKACRNVGNLKRKRKLLAAQHAFPLDLSTAPLSAPSPVTSCFPFVSSQSTFSSPHFTAHNRSCSHPHRVAYSAPYTVKNSPVCIEKAPHSAPVSPHELDPHSEKKNSLTQSSPPLHANPSSPSASMASSRRRGEHSADGMLWAVILLALLCTFLCMGKEFAFVTTTAVHLFLQVVLELGLFQPDDSVQKENIAGSNGHSGPLNRIATICVAVDSLFQRGSMEQEKQILEFAKRFCRGQDAAKQGRQNCGVRLRRAKARVWLQANAQ